MTSTDPTDTKPEPTEAPAAPAAEPTAASASAPAADAHAEGSGADEGGDDGEGEGEATGDAQGDAATAAAPGGEKKKRRRRRKKKKPEGAAAAPGAEGAEAAPAAEGEAKKPHDDKKRDKKKHDREHREARERPAFGVGDVVFGKITEITDEVLFVDLSGKGIAVFDRLELDLPEEPAQGPGSNILDDDDDFLPPKKEEGEGAAAADAPPAEATEAPAEGAAPAAEPVAAEAPKTEESPRAEGAPAAEAPRAEPAPVVTLPPVVLEVGANFVGVVHNDGGRGGLVVLTRHPRRGRKMKPLVAKALVEKTTITGLVTGAIRGGVEVDIEGLRAFAPGSHMDVRHGADLRPLVGKRLPFHVTQYAKRGRDIVLSRKSMIEAEAKTQREDALKRIVVGSVVEGTVRSVVPFGAFVDLGGIEGLVPLQEMSHNRGDTPNDVFTVGQHVDVLVQRVDVKGKIWLSRKATLPDPWADVAKKYAEGSRHRGRVARLQPFGAFIELETGVDGLIHTSDLSLKRIEHPSEVVKVGDEIDVFVASVDPSSHKIALHPVPEGATEGEVFQKVALHKIVKVVVQTVESGGLQVRIVGATGRSARGFITAAGTGTPRGTELRKHFPVGKELDAKIVEIDPRRGEAKLSIKAMNEDTERNAYKSYRQQVKQEAKFGTFGDLLKKSQDPKS
jgi:small subunit ribosomal protein S1